MLKKQLVAFQQQAKTRKRLVAFHTMPLHKTRRRISAYWQFSLDGAAEMTQKISMKAHSDEDADPDDQTFRHWLEHTFIMTAPDVPEEATRNQAMQMLQ